ncbi:MAG: ABC transporter permease [Gallionella sp.]|jgi:spermidine/putrescine transport system permease protein|nr:ABC transporter permease [Gallionella sp.]MCK9354215.1 ABC transporter permease [Gallionella sp.]
MLKQIAIRLGRQKTTTKSLVVRSAGHRLTERRGPWLWAAGLAAYAFLYLPLTIVVAYSFNDSRLNAEWVGFTLHWYRVLLEDEDMLVAAGNSLFIATVASLAATVLGTMAGIAMHRYKLKVLTFMVLAPVAMPEILLGVSLLLFFIQVLNLTLGLLSIVLAHITFSIGFVAVIVQARLAAMDESLFEAARDLGASPWQTFRHVTFPLILPAVIAGGLMAFTLSIDDFVITFFTAGVGVQTLPLRIYSMIKIAVTPEVNAVSTLLMLLTLSLTVIASRFAPDVLKGKS